MVLGGCGHISDGYLRLIVSVNSLPKRISYLLTLPSTDLHVIRKYYILTILLKFIIIHLISYNTAISIINIIMIFVPRSSQLNQVIHFTYPVTISWRERNILVTLSLASFITCMGSNVLARQSQILTVAS